MPPHPKRLQSILEKLKEIVDQIADIRREPERSRRFFIHEGASWQLIDDGVDKYNHLLQYLLNKEGWHSKYSTKYVEGIISTWIYELENTRDDTSVINTINNDFENFENYNTVQKIIIPLHGVVCNGRRVHFGDFSIYNFNQKYIDSIIDRIEKIISTNDNTDAEKSGYIDILKERYSKLTAVTTACLEIELIAEPERAREIAYLRAVSFIDLLRVMIPYLYGPDQRVSVGLAEDARFSLRSTTIFSDDMTNANISEERRGAFSFFDLSDTNLKKLTDKGFEYFLGLMKISDKDKTEIDRKLQQSIHWLADAESQPLLSNKLLSTVTFLETFFSPDKDSGMTISSTIAESIALLAFNELNQRKTIKKRVKGFYNARSRISHGDSNDILESDFHELRGITYWVLGYIYENRSEISDLQSLRNRVEDLRLS